MKKSTFKKIMAFALVVMMLASTCVVNMASAAGLTITANHVSSTPYSPTADASVLYDGVTEGNYLGGDAFNVEGTNKITEFVLDFASKTTFDTIKLYAAVPGPSWEVSNNTKFYTVTAGGEAVAVESVAVKASEESNLQVISVKLEKAVKVTTASISVMSLKYCLGLYEIEAVNSADEPVEVPSEDASSDDTSIDDTTSDDTTSDDTTSDDTTSDDTTSDDTSSDDTSSEEPVVPTDPFDGKYFILASTTGGVWTVENDSISAVAVEEGAKLTSGFVWLFEVDENGNYKITNKATGRVLDIENGLDADGTNVKTWESNDSTAQRFGLTVIQDLSDSGLGLFVYGITLIPTCSTTRAVIVDEATSAVQITTYNPLNMAHLIVAVAVTEDMIEDPVEINYAEGKKYTIVGPGDDGATEYLDGKADDGVILTDGSTPLEETPFETVAFKGTGKTNTITINLGKRYTDINKLRFGGVRINGNRQFANVVIEVSNNGSTFTKISEDKYSYAEVATDVDSTFNVEYTFKNEIKAKYVRVTLVSKEYVLAFGEIEVLGGGATSGGTVNPGENENPGDAGIAVVALVAVISLAGAVVVSKKRFN